MNGNPGIYLLKVRSAYFFAIKLNRISLATAIRSQSDSYDADFWRRQMDWLNCLINAGSELFSYDLRIFAEPDLVNYVEGKIEIYLLGKIKTKDLTIAEAHAVEVLHLCETYFEDEYEFSPVEKRRELNSLRMPFKISEAASVVKRSEIVRLDFLLGAATRSMGFKSKLQQKEHQQQRILHVYPFIPSMAGMENLLKLMLHQSHRTAISFRILPTSLREAEKSALIKQISYCENYLGSVPTHNDEKERFSLQTQAELLRSHLTSSLGKLKDNAALMTVEMASEGRLPQTLIDVLGSYLTDSSAGHGKRGDLGDFLSGGYEVNRKKKPEIPMLANFWKNIEIRPSNSEKMPKDLFRLKHLFDSSEAVLAFRFPRPTNQEIVGLEFKSYQTELFSETVKDGQLVGFSKHNGQTKEVRIGRGDRRRHVYAVGQTGTGKSTLFESMILEDLRNGEGVCLIDPHGDLIEKLLRKVPNEREEDIVLFDPGDLENPVGFNVLESENDAEKQFLIQELISIVIATLADKTWVGPVFFQTVKHLLRLVMSNPNVPGTLPQLHQLLNSKDFYTRFLPLHDPDPILNKFVEEVLPKMDFTNVLSYDGMNAGAYFSSKFEGFVSDPMLRNIFGQPHSTIDLKEIIDSGKVLLVNLSKGRMGEMNARFLGMVLIAKLQAAAMSRASIPENKRKDFYLYVDEFQNLATENFSSLLAEARKYRLNLILTNQFVSQVSNEIRDAITGNVGTTISFRVGSIDAEFLERDFVPTFNKFDLMNLPNFNTYVSTLLNGEVIKPFSMRIVSDSSKESEAKATRIRAKSRRKYAKKRVKAESLINKSLGLR